MNDHIDDQLLDRYRTDELNTSDRLRIERHLEACAVCRGELADLAAFARTVERGYAAERAAGAPSREPDWARLRAAIVARTTARAAGARRARLGRYVPQAALAVLALVAVGVLWEQGVRGPGEAERAVQSQRMGGSRPAEAEGRLRETAASGDTDRKREVMVEDGLAGAERPEPETRIGALPPPVSRDEADLRRNAGKQERALGKAAVEEDADRVEAKAPSEPSGNRADAAPLADAEREEARAAEEVAVAAAATPALEFDRFQRTARSALSEADTTLAARALVQWRDSLAPRQNLPPELERAAHALADSLAAFLASRP